MSLTTDIIQTTNIARSVIDTANILAGTRNSAQIYNNFVGATDYLNTPQSDSARNFSISKFTSTAAKFGGFIRPTHFMVMITPPQCLLQDQYLLKEGLPFICHRASTPQSIIQGPKIAHFGYGTQQFIPQVLQLNDLSFDFYIDANGSVIDIFTRWMQNIINWHPDAIGTKTNKGAFYNEVSYMESYKTRINILMYDATARNIQEVILEDAYPTSMGSINLDWQPSNNISTLSIGMSYRTWKSNFMTEATVDSNSLRNLSLGGAILSFGSGYNTTGAGSFLGAISRIADNVTTVVSSAARLYNTVSLASQVSRTLLRF